MPKPRKRKQANPFEQMMGVHGTTTSQVSDMFTNAAARQGFGTPSLGQGATYELVRLSFDYWQLITLFRNHWISRRIVEVPAQDMVKAWPKLTSDLEPKDLTRIDRALRKTNTKNNVLTGLTWGRLFGGAGGLMVIDGQENELDQLLDLESIKIGAYKGVIPFDRWAGISPMGDVCTDINRPLDFNKPEMYEVRIAGGDSFQVHSSRLLRFLGPTVPTPEQEAQSYWGISVLEPTYESITMLDNTMWNILGLTFRANLLGMKFPELAQLLSGLGSSQMATQKFEQRMSSINHLMSNQSLIPLPADGGLESTQYSFGGLEGIFQLFQLNLAGAAQMPVTRLFGRTYTGLGQSGDGDERIYEEKIATDQSTYVGPQLEKLYPVICMSELGEVPDDLDLNFPSIRVLDEKEKAELAKSVADTTTVYLNGGIMSPRTVAKEVKQSSDITGIGTNITDEDIEKLSDTVQAEGEMGEGLFGGEGAGLGEADSPAKAIKGENKEAKEDNDEKDKADPKSSKLVNKKEILAAASEAKDSAPAYDVLPSDLKVGEAVLVNGKLLTVHRVITGTVDLFDEPTVQVVFKTGEVVAYRPQQDVQARAKDYVNSMRSFPTPIGDYEYLLLRDGGYRVYPRGRYKEGKKAELGDFGTEAKAKAFIAELSEKAKATDAIVSGDKCGRPEWQTCPYCSDGRIHKMSCKVRLHKDRDCCKERGCPHSNLEHGKSMYEQMNGKVRDAEDDLEARYKAAVERLDLAREAVQQARGEQRESARSHYKRVEATTQELRAELRASVRDSEGASSITLAAQEFIDYHAIPVRVENIRGSVRGGVTPAGATWRTVMPADYGFIEGVIGADGDALDCYIGLSPESNNVFVVDQYGLDGAAFDEHKVMLGYYTEETAKEDYMLGHHLSSKTFAAITEFSVPMFRRWMKTHDVRLPCSDHVRAKR